MGNGVGGLWEFGYYIGKEAADMELIVTGKMYVHRFSSNYLRIIAKWLYIALFDARFSLLFFATDLFDAIYVYKCNL